MLGCSHFCKRHVFTLCAGCKNHPEHPMGVSASLLSQEAQSREGKGH